MNKIKKGIDKVRNSLQKFLIETKVGKYIIKSLAILNTVEGIIHLIVSFVGAWGLIDIHTYDIRVWTPVAENFVFGLFSIFTGWILGKTYKH